MMPDNELDAQTWASETDARLDSLETMTEALTSAYRTSRSSQYLPYVGILLAGGALGGVFFLAKQIKTQGDALVNVANMTHEVMQSTRPVQPAPSAATVPNDPYATGVRTDDPMPDPSAGRPMKVEPLGMVPQPGVTGEVADAVVGPESEVPQWAKEQMEAEGDLARLLLEQERNL